MALVLDDRVKESTPTVGTGSYGLNGAVTGFQAFSAALSDGDTTYYCVTDGVDWEVGIGTYASTGDEIARTTILSSSNSGSAVSWGSGDKDIFVTLPASKSAQSLGDLVVSGGGQYQMLTLDANGAPQNESTLTYTPKSTGYVLRVNGSAKNWQDNNYTVIDFGVGTALWSAEDQPNSNLSNNLYYNGSQYKYKSADYASSYQQIDGHHKFQTAGSSAGVEDAAATLQDSFVIDRNGRAFLGDAGLPISYAAATLHIKSSDSNQLRLQQTAVDNTGDVYIEFYDTAARKGIVGYASNSSNDLYIWNVENAAVLFAVNNVEKARLHTNGYWGVLTNAPTSPITAAGVIESTTGGFKFPDETTQTTAVALTNFSVTVNAAGAANLSYNNANGTFTYTPPDLSSYSTFSGSFNDLTDKPSIDDLTDVDTSTTAPTDGQALIWDNASSLWKPATVSSGGVSSIDDLTDVDTSTVAPTDGQSLVWSSTSSKWKPETVSGGASAETFSPFLLAGM